MDANLQTKTDAIISQMWTYFFGSLPTLNYAAGGAATVSAAVLMGYGGAAISLFLSCAGAYSVGAELLK